MVARKPDCTGERFGRLVVLGKGDRKFYRGSYCQTWRLQCDCGKVIETFRSNFDGGKQVSCGCKKKLGLVDCGRKCKDIAGVKFGALTAISLTGKRISGKPAWLFQCNCGNTREMPLSLIRAYERHGIRISCVDTSSHPEKWLVYPPAPNPYPKDAGDLLTKYLSLLELNSRKQVDAEIQDKMLDRLIRAAWIIVYRRSLGEQISESHEDKYMRKCLYFSSLEVFQKRKLELQIGILYAAENYC